jgi:hypothetical protein
MLLIKVTGRGCKPKTSRPKAPEETLIKSVRIELVEMRSCEIKDFDGLSPNGVE